MANHIGRRKFLATLGGAAAAWPLATHAQQPGKVPTIGFLGGATPAAQGQWAAAFVQRLRELGWIEGRTVAIEYRWAEGRSERAAEIAAEFARRKVDVIVTSGTALIEAAKQATSVIPIVFAAAGDPVGTSLVASLARPGGSAKHSFVAASRVRSLGPGPPSPRTGRAFGRQACAGSRYFVTIRRGGAVGVGAGGEIVNVTQVFQPWGRFSAANSE